MGKKNKNGVQKMPEGDLMLLSLSKVKWFAKDN
jgi:hypothetical protein